MSAQSTAINVGLTQARAVTGVSVSYSRGATELDAFQAIPGSTDWAALAEGYVTNVWESRDFVFPVAELADLDPATPASGDRITEGGRIYEVMAPAGEKHWKYSDPGRLWIRVHTKYVGDA
jgi:hypothetical protein